MAELDRNRLPVAALLMLAKLDHDVLSERECAGIGDYGAQQLDPFPRSCSSRKAVVTVRMQ